MEVAELLRVSPVTVRNWARKGELPSHSTLGGHRRFLYDEVVSFARRKKVSLFERAADRLRILIVEDDRQFADFVNESLQSLQTQPDVKVAYEGFEAGRLVQGFRPHLVLLDLMLPGIDGFSICRRLRNDPETRFIRIIAMTGHDSPENVDRILRAGAESCLAKPFKRDELLAALGTGRTLADTAVE
jgi:excisionase family DNA binding protein